MNPDPLAIAAASIVVVVGAYLFGRANAFRAERERNREICQHLHDLALTQQDASQAILAALSAAEAAGHVARHECYNVVAQTLDEVDQPAAAADYWSRARTAARQQAQDKQAYYYYREAKSFLRARSAEFAYLRSKAAIELIELGEFPPRVNDRDYLQHLRAVRMISSLQHLKGTRAWEAAMADAVWLQGHATEKLLVELGASMSAAHLAAEITADMIASV